jgi:hypothetical protein
MFFKNNKTALEVKKFKELEKQVANLDDDVKPETAYFADDNPNKRVPVSYNILNKDDNGFELLFFCNDGTCWIYTHGRKPKWTQLPDVPQGRN